MFAGIKMQKNKGKLQINYKLSSFRQKLIRFWNKHLNLINVRNNSN